MAYNNKIRLGIQLQSFSEVNEKLKNTIKKLEQNNKIDIKLGDNIVKDIASIQNQIKNIGNSLQKNLTINDPFKSAKASAKTFESQIGNSTKTINKVQNEIDKMATNLTNIKGKVGKDLFVNENSLSKIKEYEAQIENLKGVLSKLESGLLISPDGITKELNTMKNLSNELKNSFDKVDKSANNTNNTLKNNDMSSGLKSAKDSASVFEQELQKAENEAKELGEAIGKLHQKSDLKINTANGLQEAKEVNTALDERYKLEQQMAVIRSKADDNSKKREMEEQKQLNQTLKEEQQIIDEIENKRVQSQKNTSKSNYQDELNQNKAINQALEERYAKQLQLNEVTQKMQASLNSLNGNNFINDNVLKDLQTRINSINVDTPKEQIKQLQNELKNLGSNESAIVRLQNKITEMTSNLKRLEGTKLKGVVDSNVQKEVESYKKQIEVLKNLLTQLQNGTNSFNGKTVSNEISKMSQASRNLNSSLKETYGSVDTFANKISNMLSTMGIYISTAVIVSKSLQEIKDGFNHVVEVENSLIDLRRVYQMTNEEAKNLTKSMSDQALAMGTNTQTLMDLTTQWVKLGYTLEDAQNLAKETQIFDYSADLKNTEQTANSLVSILKGFGIVASDINSVGDAINGVGNNFAVSAGDINESLRVSSSALGAFGNDLNQSIAMATKMQEVLQNASTVGQSLKSIASRLTSNDNAISAIEKVGISLDDQNGKLKSTYQLIKELGYAYSNMADNAETADWLADLFGIRQVSAGVTLLKTYKELDGVITTIGESSGVVQQEFDKRMDSTSAKIDQLKQTLNQVWEETLSSDFTKGFIEGVTKIVEVFGDVPIMAGLATAAIIAFNSQALSAGLKKITEYITSLIALSTTEGVTAVATMELSMAMNTLKTAFATNPFAFLAVALVSVITLYATLRKSMQDVTDDIVNQSKEVQELNKAVDTLEDKSTRLGELNSSKNQGIIDTKQKEELIKLNNELASEYPELISQYDTESKCFEVSEDSLRELIKTKRENAMMSNALNLGDAEKQLKEYQKIIESAKKELENGSKVDLSASGRFEVTRDLSSGEKKKLVEAITNAQEQVSKLSQTTNQGTKYINDYMEEFTKGGGKIKEAKSELEKLGYTSEQINSALYSNSSSITDVTSKVEVLQKAISSIMVGKIDASSIDALNKAFPELQITTENAREKLSDLKRILMSLDDGANTQDIVNQINKIEEASQNAKSSLEDLQDQFNGFKSTKDLVSDIVEEMEKYGGITEETYSKVLGNQDVIDALKQGGDQIQNLTKLQEDCTNSMQEQIDEAFGVGQAIKTNAQESSEVIDSCFTQNANSKQNSDNSIQQSDAETNNAIRENSSETVDVNSDNYNADDTNFANIQTSKSSSDAGFQGGWRSNTAETVNSLGDMYSIDVSNFGTAMEAKNALLGQFKTKLEGISDAFAGASGGVNPLANKLSAPWVTNSNELASSVDALLGTGNQVSSALAGYKSGLDDISKSFSEASSKIDTSPIKVATPSMTKASPSMVSGGSGSGSGSKGKGSSGKSDAEKAEEFAEKLADLNSELEIDRYYDVNNALTLLDNKMSDVKSSQEYLTGSDLIKAKQKEIDIIKEQMNAYGDLVGVMKEEQSELRNVLSNYGFATDETGKLVKAQEKLAQMQDDLNAKTYEASEEGVKAKQKDIEALKKLQQQVERYTEITLTEIPKATQTWNDLSVSIRKTSLDNLTNLRESLVSALKQKYEANKEEDLQEIEDWYNARKDAMEEEYQSSVDSITVEKEKTIKYYQDQIDELQKELDSLNDDSEKKQEKLAKLKTQLSLWQQDDSVFAKKKIEELTEQIAELEKDILKDSLQDKIDNLKDKQTEEEDYYDEELSNLKEANDKENDLLEQDYKKKKEKKEELYKKLLDEKELYAKADFMITDKSQQEIINLLTQYTDTYKDVGTLLGENFRDGFVEQVKQAMNDFDLLTGQNFKDLNYNTSTSNKGNESSSNTSKPWSPDWIADKGDDVWITDASSTQVYYEPGGESRGTAWQVGIASADKLSAIDYDDGYLKLQKNGETIGWVDRYLLSRWNDISSYATGGRTPSDISSEGALSILHKNEKILNAGETNMLDRIFDYVKQSEQKISDVDNAMLEFKSLEDFIISNSGKTSNIERKVEETSKQVSLENNYNINNYNGSDASFSKRELERMAIKQAKLFR